MASVQREFQQKFSLPILVTAMLLYDLILGQSDLYLICIDILLLTVKKNGQVIANLWFKQNEPE